jgi:hypothetical protein
VRGVFVRGAGSHLTIFAPISHQARITQAADRRPAAVGGELRAGPDQPSVFISLSSEVSASLR